MSGRTFLTSIGAHFCARRGGPINLSLPRYLGLTADEPRQQQSWPGGQRQEPGLVDGQCQRRFPGRVDRTRPPAVVLVHHLVEGSNWNAMLDIVQPMILTSDRKPHPSLPQAREACEDPAPANLHLFRPPSSKPSLLSQTQHSDSGSPDNGSFRPLRFGSAAPKVSKAGTGRHASFKPQHGLLSCLPMRSCPRRGS